MIRTVIVVRLRKGRITRKVAVINRLFALCRLQFAGLSQDVSIVFGGLPSKDV